MKQVVYLLLIVFGMSACTSGSTYQLDNFGWAESKPVEHHQVLEENQNYILDFVIENDFKYPNSNLHLLFSIQESGKSLVRDSLNYSLCDPQGNWYGDNFLGMSDSWKSTIRYRHLIKVNATKKYTFTLRQAMRYDTLVGIQSVGFRINKQ